MRSSIQWVLIVINFAMLVLFGQVALNAKREAEWVVENGAPSKLYKEVSLLRAQVEQLQDGVSGLREENQQLQHNISFILKPPPVPEDEVGVLSLGASQPTYGEKLTVGDDIAIHWDANQKHYVEDKTGELIMLMSYKDKDTGEMVHLPGRTDKAREADPRKSDKGPN